MLYFPVQLLPVCSLHFLHWFYIAWDDFPPIHCRLSYCNVVSVCFEALRLVKPCYVAACTLARAPVASHSFFCSADASVDSSFVCSCSSSKTSPPTTTTAPLLALCSETWPSLSSLQCSRLSQTSFCVLLASLCWPFLEERGRCWSVRVRRCA